MATLYLFVDLTTGIIQHAQYGEPTSVPSGQVVHTIDDTAPNALATLGNSTAYQWTANGIVQLPFFTVSYANNTLTVTLHNPDSLTTPSSCTVSVAGQSYKVSLANGQGTLSISLHASLATYAIPVTVSGSGCFTLNATIGGTQALPIPIQVFTPSGGTPTIGPAASVATQWLQQYYAINNTTIEALLTNTFTALNVLYDTVFNIILPALQQSTYTPVSLTANQQNALSAIKSDVLANLVTTLTNGYPSGASSPQMQFGAFLQNWEKSSQNVQAFMNDLALFA